MKKLYNVAAFATTMLVMGKAHAQTDGANSAMQQITDASSGIPNFMMIGAYIMGIGFAITGLLKIKDAVENPGKESIKDGLFRLLIGGGLLALGTIMSYMVDTAAESRNAQVDLNTLDTLDFQS